MLPTNWWTIEFESAIFDFHGPSCNPRGRQTANENQRNSDEMIWIKMD